MANRESDIFHPRSHCDDEVKMMRLMRRIVTLFALVCVVGDASAQDSSADRPTVLTGGVSISRASASRPIVLTGGVSISRAWTTDAIPYWVHVRNDSDAALMDPVLRIVTGALALQAVCDATGGKNASECQALPRQILAGQESAF